MKRYSILTIAAAMTVAVCATARAADMYEVLIIDEIPGGLATGQPFSPPVVAVHDAGYSMFMPGAMASPGIMTVAEEGNPAVLESEAMASASVKQVVVGTGPFLDSQSIIIQGDPGDLVSMAWMLGRTNDLFTGLYDVELPASGSISFETTVWDAGTEVNTGLIADLGFYGNPMTGPDEANPIAAVSSYAVLDDPDYGMLSWDFPPSAHVMITNTGPVPIDAASWGGIKALFR